MLFLTVETGAQCSCQKTTTSVAQISQAIRAKNGQLLAAILDPNSHHIIQDLRALETLPAPYNSVFKNSALESHFQFPYQQALDSFTAYIKHLTDSYEGRWQLQVLKRICQQLYHASKHENQLQDCARNLNRLFTLCITDRTNAMENSRKWAVLFIVNILFKIYFELNNTRLCMNIIRAIENPADSFPPLNLFSASEFVTWSYYRGRIHLMDSEFEQALILLKRAYLAITSDFLTTDSGATSQLGANLTLQRVQHVVFNNKRIILTYLVGLMILIEGKFPKHAFLVRYGLDNIYGDLCTSIRDGNLTKYQSELQKHQLFLLKFDLYLLFHVELKFIVYRNLFRLIHDSHQSEGRLPLSIASLGFSLVGEENSSSSAIECIAVNLISRGLMRGYISHDKQTIVLSKKSPFP